MLRPPPFSWSPDWKSTFSRLQGASRVDTLLHLAVKHIPHHALEHCHIPHHALEHCTRQTYLEAAVRRLGESDIPSSGVDSITGIWVSSDDSNVLPEVQELAPRYFPAVREDRIVSVSFRTDAPGQRMAGVELPTTTHQMVSYSHAVVCVSSHKL